MRGLRDRAAVAGRSQNERHSSPGKFRLNGGFFVVPRRGVSTLDVSSARRIALKLVLGQAAATLGVAAVFLALSGALAARSALLGGGIGVAANLAMVMVAFRPAGSDPKRIMRGFYRGEAVKLGLTVLLFAATLKFLVIAAAPFFVAYAATFLVYWIALARSVQV
jgi:ATP synthase protein I